MRRILLILGALLLVVAVLAAVYFLFLRPDAGITVGENPFGGAGDRDPGIGPVVDTGVPTSGAGTLIAPRLLKITEGPVAAGTIALYTPAQTIASSTSTSTPEVTVPEEVEVRYIDRQSGNVYSFKVHDRVETRLSNKTLPGIVDAAWTINGSHAAVRFLETDVSGGERVSTYVLPANGEGGFFLSQDLSQVLVASSTVVALASNTTGSVAESMSIDGTNVRTVFSSVLSSLRLHLLGSRYLVETKPSAYLDGYAFLADGSSLTRVLGPLRGLSTLPSPSGDDILYSYVDRGRLYTQVLDLASRTTVPLPLATLPEKCVWTANGDALYCAVPVSLSGVLPDEWYQGARSFSDRIWRIDMDSRAATLVFDPRQLADTAIDAQALTLDRANDVLVFMDRDDGSLWSYDL